MDMIAGVIFDLDGTLIDSALDFEAMRREMQLAPGQPILETLEGMPPAEADWRWEILLQHELDGANRSRPLAGVAELLAELDRRRMPRAIITRNSRAMAEAMLVHLAGGFAPIISRDDGPAKPDPWSILHICEQWRIAPAQAVMVGDFHFDIETGRRAGSRTAYYRQGREQHPSDPPADFSFAAFDEPAFRQFLFGDTGTS
ncbi:HAD family hydrolase [Lignipirellula cremea]|uniref:Phosphoglycolate phosphatase n=1 Tax=Lignipirellula cremea TaxID=2528010 RepID=A0A518DZI0_9BACT|nr:HAD-IA family hydrolase [Lignipirellula cremea]QDU97221.1 Phosphoglycolate phosphatase [Lignipirellula cremea]